MFAAHLGQTSSNFVPSFGQKRSLLVLGTARPQFGQSRNPTAIRASFTRILTSWAQCARRLVRLWSGLRLFLRRAVLDAGIGPALKLVAA